VIFCHTQDAKIAVEFAKQLSRISTTIPLCYPGAITSAKDVIRNRLESGESMSLREHLHWEKAPESVEENPHHWKKKLCN